MDIEYGYRIDTFYIQIDKIIDMNINEIHNEKDYLALFDNLNLEEISSRISQASSTINNLLYDVKEDERPTLLSILLIALFESKNSKYRIHLENNLRIQSKAINEANRYSCSRYFR